MTPSGGSMADTCADGLLMGADRWIEFLPAWDERSDDPAKNYGIHGMELRFYCRFDDGSVIQFVVYTGWMLPQNRAASTKVDDFCQYWRSPMAAHLGYHSIHPLYKGQQCLQDKCDLYNGAPCYYDGSTMAAEPVLERLIAEGHDGVWAALESFHAAHSKPYLESMSDD